ncbi:TRAP transporter small permease [Variovorax sp. PCZ-1]|uniref:TRAP transporter small permease n=1 Tax=Variovorax sp. PCZ-1 TaxID=2835533 RepID=UPI001BCD7742|nr:TRAP transporter small permease [Variovorax sp. PCZ-1]MBS7809071.1 TRAP transporter small permease [Variovorax sp. PCZ-1]
MKQALRELEGHIAVACMALLVVITLLNVLVRYFTDQSFAWTEEISVFLMGLMCFAGAASVAGRDQHIRIEFFYDGGSASRQRSLKIFSSAVSVVFFLVLSYLFTRLTMDEIKYEETSMGLGIPRWWYSVWLPPLCMAIALRTLWWGLKVARVPLVTEDKA